MVLQTIAYAPTTTARVFVPGQVEEDRRLPWPVGHQRHVVYPWRTRRESGWRRPLIPHQLRDGGGGVEALKARA
jgi:hypothetical protein